MISNKQHLQKFNESTNDVLTNRVQNILEKTLICRKFDSNHNDNIKSSFNDNDQKNLFKTSEILLNHHHYDNNGNDDLFDDLTEYYPIKKNIINRKNQNLQIKNESETTTTTTTTTSTNDHNLIDLILFQKNYLNTQIDNLKKLNHDIIKIEKYLLKSNKKIRKKFNEKLLFKNYIVDNCNHGNIDNIEKEEKILKQHKNIHSLNYFHNEQQQQQQNNCLDTIKFIKYFNNENKQHAKQTHEILHNNNLIEKINKQKYYDDNDNENEMMNKSVQTSLIFNNNNNNNNNNVNINDDNELFINKLSLSWFIEFIDNDNDDDDDVDVDVDVGNYQILHIQTYNLIDLFERNKQKFKHLSLLRLNRINDNINLRIETAEQRRNEILQVYQLNNQSKNNLNNFNFNKTTTTTTNKNKNHINRPLIPINRRVFTHQQMRKQTEKIYKKSSESINNSLLIYDKEKREDDAKKRRIMVQIFKQKLKDNTVRGRLNWPITSQTIID